VACIERKWRRTYTEIEATYKGITCIQVEKCEKEEEQEKQEQEGRRV
jgi:hypothetical protein